MGLNVNSLIFIWRMGTCFVCLFWSNW